jgi:hypothetical protein
MVILYIYSTSWHMKLMFYERQHPPSTQETSMVDPLGGDAGDPGAPTINARKVDGGPPCPLGGSILHPGSERCVVLP